MYEPKYFTEYETGCKCGTCGRKQGMSDEILEKADRLREMCGFGLPMSSGFRCKAHPKNPGGPHGTGNAFDILIGHERAYIVLKNAMRLNFKGIGIKQKGTARFIHLDDCEATELRPRPHIWSY